MKLSQRVLLRASYWGAVLGVALCITQGISVMGAVPLPQWSKEDQAKLRKGELIPGASLLVEDEDGADLPKVTPEPDEKTPEPVVPPEPEYDPKTIPSEYLANYFQTVPEGYLIDPQRLLTMQETMDREGFLKYHAEDSKVDIKLYLFDAQQEIPSPYSLEKLAQERYSKGPLTAIVFYFVGDPSRSMFALGGEGAEKVNAHERRKILESARLKSLEKSDPSAQVESFIVQLSIRLYWLEKSLESTEVTSAPPVPSPSPSEAPVPADVGFFAKVKPYILYLVVGGGGVLLSLTSMAMAWVLWRKNRKYRFPVIELPRRLGADYGAGVGAVLGFRDALSSPASQRDQVPDYLLRM